MSSIADNINTNDLESNSKESTKINVITDLKEEFKSVSPIQSVPTSSDANVQPDNVSGVSEEDHSNKKVDRKPKKKKPGFHDQMFEETSYYFRNGLRYVYPYEFKFTAHTKGRWLGLQLIELFQREFHMESLEYYEEAIKSGKVRVNNQIVSRDRILTQKDILQTCVHRHEPPVIYEQLELIVNDDQLVVVNKPSSIPVHPCGRYRHNTIVFLLGKEHGLHGLHTIHRIDRLTSGILMFAKTPGKAKEMESVVKGRLVEKTYLCRVVGDFPNEEIDVNQPISISSHKVGVCRVHPDGKPCLTRFQKLSYNGSSSLVKCYPHTGRMHQIRVHLQWLGHPIVNDPIYNHPTAWGPEVGKRCDAINFDNVVAELIRTRKDQTNDDSKDATEANNKRKSSASTNQFIEHPVKKTKIEVQSDTTNVQDSILELNSNLKDVPNCEEATTDSLKIQNTEANVNSSPPKESLNSEGNNESVAEAYYYTSRDIGEQYHDDTCTQCRKVWIEPTKLELVMYLHAMNYKGPGFEYTASLPSWAEDGFSG